MNKSSLRTDQTNGRPSGNVHFVDAEGVRHNGHFLASVPEDVAGSRETC